MNTGDIIFGIIGGIIMFLMLMDIFYVVGYKCPNCSKEVRGIPSYVLPFIVYHRVFGCFKTDLNP